MDGWELSTKIFVLMAGIPLAAISRGFVLSIMWSWFVVPVFHLPPLTIPYALGISMLMGALLDSESSERERKGVIGGMVFILLAPWFLLACAWVVTWFL
jgi:hypothetical protein